MELITVVIRRLENGNVDSRAYDSNGLAIMAKDGTGNDYHLGQISSSPSWAMSDMQEHFSNEYDALFPDGWKLVFDEI